MKLLGHAAALAQTAWLALRERWSPAAPAVSAGEVRSILVLGYAAIGDLLFFLPVLEGLRRRYPAARIVFLANRYPTTEELVPSTGLADEVWLWEWEGAGAAPSAAPILRRIREARFDLAVLTLSSPAHYFQAALRDIPLRAGHCRDLAASVRGRAATWRRALVTGEPARRVLLDRKAWIGADSEHAVARNLRLLDALGVPRPPEARPRLSLAQERRDWAARALGDLPPGRRRVVVHPGPPDNQYFKMWPAERFGELCARLGEDMSADIVLVGSRAEEPGAAAVLRTCPQARSWVGKASLMETFALMERCDLFLGNDTGLAKAAMALGVRTATIYGPTDPVELGVFWEPEKHLEIRIGIFCSPCVRLGMAKEGPGVLNYAGCGHHDCLNRLGVDSVLVALRVKFPALFGA